MQPIIDFKANLNQWADQATSLADRFSRSLAKEEIEKAAARNSKLLSIRNRNLSTLPEAIASLNKVEELFLKDNQFAVIPPSVLSLPSLKILDVANNALGCLSGTRLQRTLEVLSLSNNLLTCLPGNFISLSNLKILELQNNKLTEVPPGIAGLVSLEVINLSSNQLRALPRQICGLTSLNQLMVAFNRLESLPEDMGNLRGLTKLVLTGNALTALPPSMGALESLEEISLTANSQLKEVPPSLGNHLYLWNFETYGTSIVQPIAASVLNSNKMRKDLRVLLNGCGWTHRVAEFDFLYGLPEEQRFAFRDWLGKIFYMKDSKMRLDSFSLKMCKLILSLKECVPFKEFFFSQLINITGCGDHTSMGVNQLYTAWRVLTLDPATPAADAIKIMAGCAKTIALRKALGNLFEQRRIAGKGVEKESAEVMLYYEIQLRASLGLDTAVEEMEYSFLGKKKWISITQLKEQVLSSFKDVLLTLPVLQTIAERDPVLMRKWQTRQRTFTVRQTELDSKVEHRLKEEDYLNQTNELKLLREKAYRTLLLEWIDNGLKKTRQREEAEEAIEAKKVKKSESSESADSSDSSDNTINPGLED